MWDESEGRGRSGDWQDAALVCMNGHLINSGSKYAPHRNTKFCEACGAATTSKCLKCSVEIRGAFHYGRLSYGRDPKTAPSYCHNCGEAYPWTERTLTAALELIELAEDISDNDKAVLVKAVPDLLRETPQTAVAATRWKKFLNGPGKAVGEGVKQVFIDVVAESVKRTIWGP